MSIKPQDLNNNRSIAGQLSDAVSKGSVVHAYAFAGGSREDREELGNWLARYLLCQDPDGGPCMQCLACTKALHGNHEDLIYIRKPEDRESIVKDQILALIDRLSYKPYGRRYVAVIEDAHLMNAAAQNKLLKTLEEPVSEAVMILLAEREEALLPTVLSRCCVFRLEEPRKAPGAEDEAAEKLAGLIKSGAAFYRKKAAVADITADKENGRKRAEELLGSLEEKLMELLKDESLSPDEKGRVAGAVHQAETSLKYIKQLHSVAYTLKQFCLRA